MSQEEVDQNVADEVSGGVVYKQCSTEPPLPPCFVVQHFSFYYFLILTKIILKGHYQIISTSHVMSTTQRIHRAVFFRKVLNDIFMGVFEVNQKDLTLKIGNFTWLKYQLNSVVENATFAIEIYMFVYIRSETRTKVLLKLRYENILIFRLGEQ